MIHQQESTGAYAFDASILSPFGAEVPADLMAQYAAIVLLEPEPETFRQWGARLARSVMALTEPEPHTSASEWFIAEVAPQSERKVTFALSQAGFAVFLPMETDWGKTHGRLDKTKLAYAPRFPGYIFVLIDQTYVDEKRRTQFRQVMETEGVNGFVDILNGRGEGRPAPLPASQIIKLQADERAGRYDLTVGPVKPPPYRPKRGDRVQVVSGGYITRVGEVVSTPKKTRVKVLFDDGLSPMLQVSQVKALDERAAA